MPIVWREQLNTGNDLIDHDHKYLFCLFNSIELAVGQRELLKHLPIFFDQLHEYTREHFEREETIQVKVGYPGHAEHRQMHAEILKQLDEVSEHVRRVASSGDSADAEALHRELFDEAMGLAREWIINHVVKVDSLMKPYLARYSSEFR
jgi:hemerythrin